MLFKIDNRLSRTVNRLVVLPSFEGRGTDTKHSVVLVEGSSSRSDDFAKDKTYFKIEPKVRSRNKIVVYILGLHLRCNLNKGFTFR